MKTNEIAMLKSASIKLSNDRTAIVVMNYHTEKETGVDGKEHTIKGKSFYRCDVSVRSNADWNQLIAQLESDKDAEFKLSDVGLQMGDVDFTIMYAKKTMTKGAYARFISNKIKKAEDHATFLGTAFEGKEPFGETYVKDGASVSIRDLAQLENLTDCGWYAAIKQAQPRKPRVVKAKVEAPAVQTPVVDAPTAAPTEVQEPVAEDQTGAPVDAVSDDALQAAAEVAADTTPAAA